MQTTKIGLKFAYEIQLVLATTQMRSTTSKTFLLHIVILCVTGFFSPLFSQLGNLVLNPSFENYTYPAIRTWPSTTTAGQQILPGWVTPSMGTADYYNSDLSTCDGSPIAKARTGEGRIAILAGLETQNTSNVTKNYKEYIQGKFTQPLEAGKKYCIKFHVALDRTCYYTSPSIGAYISQNAIRSDNREPFQFTPQIVSHKLISPQDGWTEISGVYVAQGGERFITLGSFSDTSVISLSQIGKSSETTFLNASQHIRRGSYFYIDDVSVTLDDGKICDCSIKKTDDRPGDYYMFLIDISGSMNKSGKLDLMKKEIIKFTQNLNENNRIGIMAFSDHAKIVLPFLGPSDSILIDSTINNLKSHGVTNGDLAIHRVSEIIDSLHLPQRCHVIIATDGIFNITEGTKTFADSILNKNNTSFCVLQFGNHTNEDLEEITQGVPYGFYNYVSKHTAPKIIEQQLPPPAQDPSTVYYTQMAKATGDQILENIIKDMTH